MAQKIGMKKRISVTSKEGVLGINPRSIPTEPHQPFVDRPLSIDSHSVVRSVSGNFGNGERLKENCDFTFCAPVVLQRFRTAQCVLFWKCWSTFTQSQFSNGILTSSLSTIERRFNLSSRQSGFIVTSFDLAMVLVLLPMTFWGNHARKLRLESVGMFIMSASTILFALPHLVAPQADTKISAPKLCRPWSNLSRIPQKPTCSMDKKLNGIGNYLYLFCTANFLFGIGAAPILTTGTAYIDDNTSARQAPLYIGIMNSFIVIGSTCGFILSGSFLRIYADIYNKPDNLDPSDLDRWIGAWWIGPIVTSALALIGAIPLYGFPYQLPGSKTLQLQRRNESFGRSSERASLINNQVTLKTFVSTMNLLIQNRTFVLISFAVASEMFFVTGCATFGPKILELKFGMSASDATFYSGVSAVISGTSGLVAGGAVEGIANLHLIGTLRLVCGLSILCLPVLSFLKIPCSPRGDALPFIATKLNCSANCNCETVYSPGCGADGINYFSPCHAGCTVALNKTFFNCSCIQTGKTGIKPEWNSGPCPANCSYFYIYMVLISFELFITFFMAAPILHSILRSVPMQQKSLALGAIGLMSRLFGSVPGPVIFGLAIDKACELGGQCSDNAALCQRYSLSKLGQNLILVTILPKVITVSSLWASYLTYKAPPEPKIYTYPLNFSDSDDVFPRPYLDEEVART